MKFIIKPDDDSFAMLMEAQQYRRLWKQHSRKIRAAFRALTGLEFQQRVITARVYQGRISNAGLPYQPMKLAGDNRSEDYKLMTMIHELAHRLLGGNALGVVNLGLASPHDKEGNTDHELEHRHIYLFVYDVVQKSLGNEKAKLCRHYESKGVNNNHNDTPHDRAWNWAMQMTFSERQRAVNRLAAKKVIREQWRSLDDTEPARVDADAWFGYLQRG